MWERDLVPNPGSCTSKLTAHDVRPTPGKPGYQHCAHCRLSVSGDVSLMRGMNKPCVPFCGVHGGLSRVHFTHSMMQVEDFPQVFWCAVCGAIRTKQTKLLLAPCKGVATKRGKYVRGQLETGYLPNVATMEYRVWVGVTRSVLRGRMRLTGV